MGIFDKILGMKDVEVAGNKQVRTFQKEFKDSFGTEIRVYKSLNTGKGSRRADGKSTLASVCAEGRKVTSIKIKKSHTVSEIEDQFKDQMGIGIQIMGPDGKDFAPNGMKLKDIVSEMS